MINFRLYLAQRASAALLIPLVVTHIIVMIIAIRDGLTLSEILERTQGSLVWFLFYGLFVLAVSLHGSIGLRVILHETFGLRTVWLQIIGWASFFVLLIMGGSAVWAVTFAGGAP